MAKSDETRFQCDLGGVHLELAGEREFVEQMYRLIMRDVEIVRAIARGDMERTDDGKVTKTPKANVPAIWVHSCHDLIRRIYMAPQQDLEHTLLGTTLDLSRIHTVFVNKDVMEKVFGWLAGQSTLWSEFTASGRREISAASHERKTPEKK